MQLPVNIELEGTGNLIAEPFNPLDPNSPTVTYYSTYGCGQGFTPGKCIGEEENCGCAGSNSRVIAQYEVNHHNLDNDPIMNHLLEKPTYWLRNFY